VELVLHILTWITQTVGQNVLGTIVSVVVAWLVKRWINQLKLEQRETRVVATEAVTESKNAAAESKNAAQSAEVAGRHAKSASDGSASAASSSKEVGEAVVILATELGAVKHQLADALDVKEHLKERNYNLFGALALAEARRKAANPESLPLQVAAALDTDATTITGKHRLHTSMIPTTNATPTQDDDFL
jgi:hypothetical protein